MVVRVQLYTCPGRGVGMGSGLIQFSQLFFSSLKGPFITLVISSRLYTHTADSSSLSLHNRTHTRSIDKWKAKKGNGSEEMRSAQKYRSEAKQMKVPLWGEYAIEVCAAGVSRLVLYSKHISQNIKALSTCSIFTHQLSLQKRRPPPLQSLHTTYIRLENRARDQNKSGMI